MCYAHDVPTCWSASVHCGIGVHVQPQGLPVPEMDNYQLLYMRTLRHAFPIAVRSLRAAFPL